MVCIVRTLLGLVVAISVVTISETKPVRAQATETAPANCDALKNSLVPYQVQYKANGQQYSIQVFRDKSGTAVEWIQFRDGSAQLTTKAIQQNGFDRETESVNSVQALDRVIILSHLKTQARYEGLDTDAFDYKRNATFKLYSQVDLANGTPPRESESSLEYKFLREEPIAVDGCPFSSVVFEATRSIADQKSHLYYRYMPELKLRIGNSTPELAIDDITTVFESMKLPAP
jgi:hypothetical protein